MEFGEPPIQRTSYSARFARAPLSRRLGLAVGFLVLAGLAGACTSQEPSRPNLLVITVDTLRPDHVGAWGYEKKTSTAIDRLARESLLFENARSHSSWTLPSIASLMTSRYASSHGCWDYASRLPPSVTTLAERLRDGGYATAAVPGGGPIGTEHGLAQGFEGFFAELLGDEDAEPQRTITSPDVTRIASRWLEGRADDRRPWFLWAHYFDPHFEYLPHDDVPKQFHATPPTGLDEPWALERFEVLYDGEIAYTDRFVGKLLERVAALPRGRETVIVLTADHGEEFQEHGGLMHGFTLFEEVIRVPLAIRIPGEAGRRVEEAVGLVDVLPTVLDALGLEVPEDVEGRSLLPGLRAGSVPEAPLLSELRLFEGFHADGIVDDSWKLIVDRSNERRLLFDLREDPGEAHDLASEHPDRVERLERRLEAMRARARASAPAPPAEFEPSEALRERLRALGYVDPPREAAEAD